MPLFLCVSGQVARADRRAREQSRGLLTSGGRDEAQAVRGTGACAAAAAAQQPPAGGVVQWRSYRRAAGQDRRRAGGRAEGPPEEWRVFIARRALGQAGRGSLSEAREKRRDRWLEHLL